MRVRAGSTARWLLALALTTAPALASGSGNSTMTPSRCISQPASCIETTAAALREDPWLLVLLLLAVCCCCYCCYCCCCRAKQVGLEPVPLEDVEAAEAGGEPAETSALVPEKRGRRAAMCVSGPLEPSPRSKGPLYPLPPEAAAAKAEREAAAAAEKTATALRREELFDSLCAKYGKAECEELRKLKPSQQMKRAEQAGATEEQLDDAGDSVDPKEARLALLLSLLHPEK